MSQTLKYCLSITPELYESALTPEDFLLEEIKARAATEEKYMEAEEKRKEEERKAEEK